MKRKKNHYKNPKCWAKNVSSCSQTISREHIISKCLIEDDGFVTLQGLNWCLDEPKTIGINSAVSNILCRKHNSKLSDLDAFAQKTKQILFESYNEKVDRSRPDNFMIDSPSKTYTINAVVFERWCFKTVVNILLTNQYGEIKDWVPPSNLANYIFNRCKLPIGCGIGIYKEDALMLENRIDFKIVSFDNKINSCIFNFFGLKLLCSWKIPIIGHPCNDGKVYKKYFPCDLPDNDISINNRFFYRCKTIRSSNNVKLVFDWN